MLPVKVRKDPAPSRIKYRLERLWLRPAVRRFAYLGLPIIAISALVAAAISNPTVRAAALAQYDEVRARIVTHPGLAVTEVNFPGAKSAVAERVAAALALDLPVSSLEVDLVDLHRKVVALGFVESATVRLEAGGVLEISFIERQPAILWRNGAEVMLLDRNGIVVDRLASRMDRSDLALLAGEDADGHVPEALMLLATAEPIRDRIRALIRIGERRWDLVLDRDQVIRLPETEPVAALARVMGLHAAEDILGRDITVVDMRDGRRPILRLTPYAVGELQKLREFVNGENG